MLLFLGHRPSRNPPWRLLNFQNVCAVFPVVCVPLSLLWLLFVLFFFHVLLLFGAFLCCCLCKLLMLVRLLLFVLFVLLFFSVLCAASASFAAAFAAAFGSPTVEKPTLAALDLPKCSTTFLQTTFYLRESQEQFFVSQKAHLPGPIETLPTACLGFEDPGLCARHTSLRTFDELQTRIQTFSQRSNTRL